MRQDDLSGGRRHGGHRSGAHRHPSSRLRETRDRPLGGGRGVLSADQVRLLLLSLIGSGHSHGYELMRSVKRQTRGAYAPSPGMVYPALASLEDQRFIAAVEADGRKSFALTSAGEAELASNADAISTLNARLSALAEVDREQHAPIRRAMDNLKAVLANAAVSPEKVSPHDVAALIDDAAQKIERLS